MLRVAQQVRASHCDCEGRGFEPRLSIQNPFYEILWTILRPPWTYRRWWFRFPWERTPKEYSIREKIYWVTMFTPIKEQDMIDIEKIERAHNRFKAMYDHLVFKAVEMKQSEKDTYGKTISVSDRPIWEVRCNSRFIYKFFGEDSEKSAKEIVERLNKSLEDYVQEEYDLMLNEIKEAES